MRQTFTEVKNREEVIVDLFCLETAITKVQLLVLDLKPEKLRYNEYF